jgi:hypothetical protein
MSMYLMSQCANEMADALKKNEQFRKVAESVGPPLIGAAASAAGGPLAGGAAGGGANYVARNHPDTFASIAAGITASVAVAALATFGAPIILGVAGVAAFIDWMKRS